MSQRMVETALWVAVAGSVALGLAGWRSAPRLAPIAPAALLQAASIRSSSAEEIARAAESIPEHDLFRADRRPADVEYSPEAEGAPPLPPPPPKPVLTVVGIVGGPPWEAVVEGLPGRSGSVVVRKGDVIGELRIRSVGRDTVVIVGADTAWRLSVRRAW